MFMNQAMFLPALAKDERYTRFVIRDHFMRNLRVEGRNIQRTYTTKNKGTFRYEKFESIKKTKSGSIYLQPLHA